MGATTGLGDWLRRWQEGRCRRCQGAGHLKAPRPFSNPVCPACKGSGRRQEEGNPRGND